MTVPVVDLPAGCRGRHVHRHRDQLDHKLSGIENLSLYRLIRKCENIIY